VESREPASERRQADRIRHLGDRAGELIVSDEHDVVIVGAGISGAILANELAKAGMRVLVLEAGTDLARTFGGYQNQLETFYGAFFKTPEGPYAYNPNSPQPDIPGIPTPGADYFVETGPVPYQSTYARVAGGTTLHWLGTCLRMLPEDFQLRSRFGRGRDWPIGYNDLAPDYERAEWEIGVSADVQDQSYLGLSFREGYGYPMRRIPPSWLDGRLAERLDGTKVTLGGEERPIQVRSTPAARNSTPNAGYSPVGAVDLGAGWGPPETGQALARDIGERCQGNSSCVPICPVQAKYNALKTLAKATATGRVQVLAQAVASKVLVEGRRVTGIEYLSYGSPDSPRHTVKVARGRTYVLACHAVENAKLLLMSGLQSASGLVGQGVFDHPVLLAWGLMPEPAGAYRGPLSTSGIEDLRGGSFRSQHGAFRIELGNDGWTWPKGAPGGSVADAVSSGNLFGRRLRESLRDTVPRHVRVGCLIEQLGEPGNRISIDPRHVDALGLPRPVIHYGLREYELAGMEQAARVARLLFKRVGIEDRTDPANSLVATASWKGKKYAWGGAGHIAGTHVMGADASSSVVDSRQRAWDQDNLHIAGSGSMPTMGTSNPTLTVAALALRAARDVIEHPDGRRSK
jgi:choline dehydrogenase-like flavoprotein